MERRTSTRAGRDGEPRRDRAHLRWTCRHGVACSPGVGRRDHRRHRRRRLHRTAIASRRERQHDGVRLAGPLRRLVGGVLDWVFFTVLWILVFVVGNRCWDLRSVALIAASLAVTAAYQVAPVALRGRTLGKLIAGTRVVTVTDLAVPGWRRAICRRAVVVAPELLATPLP